MASPLKHIGEFLFGAPQTSAPMLMAPPPAPPAATPASAPTGSASTYKNASGPSFLSAAAPAATQQQTAGKSLLGQ